jgi:DNA/RNA-binding domain of Phe-tRNA-synthetase-like protein
MKSRVSDVENFASAGYSTPAMCELEKKLVKSFFALKDTESYLSPDKQFELFQQIKTSTPKVWEKKDGVVAVDDKELITGLKKKDGVATGAEETADDYKGFAEKLVTAAGLSKDK